MAEFYMLDQIKSASRGPGRGPRHMVSSQRLRELKSPSTKPKPLFSEGNLLAEGAATSPINCLVVCVL